MSPMCLHILKSYKNSYFNIWHQRAFDNLRTIYFIFSFLLLSLVSKSHVEIFCKGVKAPEFSLTAIKIEKIKL